jgi:TrpR-related protein YerC/YecD
MKPSIVRSEETDQLFRAILSLQSKEECYDFFEDLCTVNEIRSLSLRLEVARRLKRGETYLDIIEETNKSSAIISRIKNCLMYGKGGFQMMLQRLEDIACKDTDEGEQPYAAEKSGHR